MRNVLILLGTLLCLFGPMIIFTIIGRKALEELGKRPSEGASAMIPMTIKLVAVTAALIGLLMIMLKVFAPA